ncbi:hypothetical protein ACO0QE_004647 [Hanseniaspora vineae]
MAEKESKRTTADPTEYDILGLNFKPDYKPDVTNTLTYYDTLRHLQDMGMSSKVIFAPHELKTMAKNSFNKTEIEKQKKALKVKNTIDPCRVKYHNFLDLQNKKNSGIFDNAESFSPSSSSNSSQNKNTPEQLVNLDRPKMYTHLLLKTTNIPPSELKQYDTNDLMEYSYDNDANSSNVEQKYDKQEAYEVYTKYQGRAL